MEFNEVPDRRKPSRQWTNQAVDFAAAKRILGAGMKAPSRDHYRNWQFILFNTQEEKERAFSHARYSAGLDGHQHWGAW